MLQTLTLFLPRATTGVALLICMIGSLLGCALWLGGARFSRGILTLAAVTIGGLVGVHLSDWCGWGVDNMGPAVAGAMILGISAFTLHRFWVGLSLGAVMACWAALFVWVAVGESRWHWPRWFPDQMLPGYLALVWSQLPDRVATWLPWASGFGMAMGIAIAFLWPRLGVVSLWSALGVTLLGCMAIAAMQQTSPGVLRHSQELRAWEQAGVILMLIGIGLTVQWRWLYGGEGSRDA
jgi:hypothetical protein